MEDEDTLLSAEDFSEDEYAETLGGTEAEAETDELESACKAAARISIHRQPSHTYTHA